MKTFTDTELEVIAEALGARLAGDLDETGHKAETYLRAHEKVGQLRRAVGRERAMLRLLHEAVGLVNEELAAAGNTEEDIQHNPMLRHRAQFVNRARRRIREWEGA